MMFFPNSFPSAPFDPVERDRVESGRPATRLEILHHQHRAMRHDAIKMATEPNEDAGSSVLHIVPETLDGIRRSLSRMLVHAGHRIGPEAA